MTSILGIPATYYYYTYQDHFAVWCEDSYIGSALSFNQVSVIAREHFAEQQGE